MTFRQFEDSDVRIFADRQRSQLGPANLGSRIDRGAANNIVERYTHGQEF